MKIKAVVFGATGMVGEGVLLQALDHPFFLFGVDVKGQVYAYDPVL